MKTSQIEHAATQIRKLWEKHGVKKPFRFLGFCLSLLSIPIISQIGQVLDRHLSDKSFENELGEMWNKIASLNDQVSKIETLEESILEIAKTVEKNSSLQEACRKFICQLEPCQTEFIAIAQDGSFQIFLDSFINTETAYFRTQSGSTNVIENTNVKAKSIIFYTNNSKNFVNKSNFEGRQGNVSMHGISTQGKITIKDSSIEFGENASITF